MEWKNENYVVSDAKELLQVDKIHQWLNDSYWASGRSKIVIQQTIDASVSFGLYSGEEQIGFARSVTDRAVFSWLLDVVIDEAYRGKGLGKWFISCILEHPDLKQTRMGLATRDAHTLYEKFGFKIEESMRQSKS